MDLAALLLLTGAIRHYAWSLFPDAMQGAVSKALGAAATLVLLSIVWRKSYRSWLLSSVLLWWAWEELQTALCSAWYAIEPWPVPDGQGICSAKVGFDLGAAGILIVAVLAMLLSGNTSTRNGKKEAQ